MSIRIRTEYLLSLITIEEKLRLLSSRPLLAFYSTTPIKRLGIPQFGMTDGPLGVARHSGNFKKCTRFPAPIALAATWNRKLSREFGLAVAREVRSICKHMILAPGINIHRTPLNGRTFEYFSEDPYLTKEMAIPFVEAVQSLRVGACIKHYAANNQETFRQSVSSEIDERTLHEIYLRAFEAVVKEAQPWAVMAAYNKVNGTYCCENRRLLREILVERWNYKGFVMSDWFATEGVESAESCINAGLSLEMPLPRAYTMKSLVMAYNERRFSEETLNDLVRRFVRAMFLAGLFDSKTRVPHGARNTPQHQELARRIAEESIVLLKNQQDLLPIKMSEIGSIALLGPNVDKEFGRFLYGGSSAVVPPWEITSLDGMKEKCGTHIDLVSDPAEADIAIVFAGLNHDTGGDSESSDRVSMKLPPEQVDLILETAETNPRTVVVLISGSPLAMSQWLDRVPAVIETWYGGMEGGRAITNVLFGDVNPSGKLPITFPRQLKDSPAHSTGSPRTFPGDEERRVYYDEGIFVGYRWFDEKEIAPLFPFGFGLSYTDFGYRRLSIEKETLSDIGDSIDVSLEIENTGSRKGSEVVQLYYSYLDAHVERPPKQLASFEKVSLAGGEKKTVELTIKGQDLAFYDINRSAWRIEPGTSSFLVGASSQDIRLESSIQIGNTA
ncbi:MAG: glycoside hydrolase family 3 C-terminal domain-containing protein [Candidatus Thorarchaeota archaeon]|nr:glycoside hydrolase family 3 C-terminal domain-containing protein [Candidatus Thorarchaeota archaeon]